MVSRGQVSTWLVVQGGHGEEAVYPERWPSRAIGFVKGAAPSEADESHHLTDIEASSARCLGAKGDPGCCGPLDCTALRPTARLDVRRSEGDEPRAEAFSVPMLVAKRGFAPLAASCSIGWLASPPVSPPLDFAMPRQRLNTNHFTQRFDPVVLRGCKEGANDSLFEVLQTGISILVVCVGLSAFCTGFEYGVRVLANPFF
ncbi:hypothetical protein LX36DRAFT_660922 [Colletotrichum falcatum]|nr:hypothetical protein LX36DRAFT_660922 [Colletotrichum falcatum]